MKLGADNTLPTGTVLDVDNANAGDNAIFDLNGFNQTAVGLQRSGAGSGTGGSAVTNSGAADKTLTLTGTGAGTYTYSGNITDGATNKLVLVKSGPGTQVLSGSNGYTGATTISGGVLQLGVGGATGSLSTSSAITNDATLSFNRTNTVTQGVDFANAISGTGAVIQTGSGTLVLGANTYTGATTVNAGRLDITGSLTSNVTVAGGANLGGEGSTTGSLTFLGTSNFFFDPSTVGALSANSLTASGATVTLNLTSAASGTGIVVISTNNVIAGTPGTNFLFTGRGSTYLSGDSKQLLFDYAPGSLKWTGTDGTNPSFWDVNTTNNWDNGGSSEKFFAGDAVTFNDNASSYYVVVQGAAVQSGNVTFNNSTNAYTVSGGAILDAGSPTSLVKDGTNTVLLSSSNGYTGGTIINAGKLVAASANALGAGAVTNNATLYLTAAAPVTYSGLSTSLSGTGTVNVTLGAGTAAVILNGNYSGFTGIWNVGVGAGAGAGKVQMNGADATGATVNLLPNATLYVTTGGTATRPSALAAVTPASRWASFVWTPSRSIGRGRSRWRERLPAPGTTLSAAVRP